MIKYVDLSKSKEFTLPFFNDKEAKQNSNLDKGWSYSNVYHLIEIKNVFIALKQIQYIGINDFSKKAIYSGLPFVKTVWDNRRILEQLNALINFGLISKEYKVETNYFTETTYTDILSVEDWNLFKKIYHEYFRFKELHSWLLCPSQDDHVLFLNQVSEIELEMNSKPIFPFSRESRFSDSFIYSLENNTDIFKIPNDTGELMRFWDVYVKWGQELKLLEKFNLKNLDFELSSHSKSLCCVYYVNPDSSQFKLLDFIRSEYSGRHIHIPKLILKIALKYRYRISDIKKMVISQALEDANSISLQRTSEIFIRNTEKDFIPQYRDSYISHLLLQ